MKRRMFSESLRAIARRGLRPSSPAAFAFAVLCVAVATLLRMAIDLVAPQAIPYATYFPAILVATLIAGLPAGIFATLLSALAGWFLFVPPRHALLAFTPADLVSLGLFVFASIAIMWAADQYRRMLRRLDEEEHYRRVVVDELGHRVKNKLATIYAILRHELRGHPDLWESISGRLRALSAADDFLVKSGGTGIDLRQILTMELEPYGAASISIEGEPLQLHGKLPVVLSLIFHELATNAAKYGALSAPGGRLAISWHPDGEQVAVEWQEIGGPPVAAPSRRSFGSNLIERSLDSFGGSAKIEFAAAGVICRLRFPKPAAPDAPETRAGSTLVA